MVTNSDPPESATSEVHEELLAADVQKQSFCTSCAGHYWRIPY